MLRGIAAVSVVSVHAFGNVFPAEIRTANQGWLTTVGAVGVDLFFVISGFIMLYVSFPAQSAPLKSGQFLLRRATRIYPFYWVCGFGVVALWMAGFLGYRTNTTVGTIINSLLLVPNPDLLIGVSWTLSYEMFFYLIFAATLVFRSRVVSVLLSTFVITAVILVGSRLPDGEMNRFLSNPVMLEFCFGLLLALAWSRGVRSASVLWMVPGFLVIIAAPLVFDPRNLSIVPSIVRPLAWGLPSVAVLAGFLVVVSSKRPWIRFFMLVGDASYAIYLTHPFVMVIHAKLLNSTSFGGLPQLPVIPLVIALSVAIGIAAHIVIEAPILAVVRNFLRSWRGGILAGQSASGP